METRGVITARWRVEGTLPGLERIAGVQPSALESSPLYHFVHPGDAVRLARVYKAAATGPDSTVVRMGAPGQWRRVHLLLGRWRNGRAVVVLRAARPAKVTPPLQAGSSEAS